ncbi:hypothetical protein [Lysinibacillus sp. NPDC047702]|uniref:hypothetical protein n=1 Tax=unclassified Lysinibacillus TaxID=2636778 RepID=UPI003CFD3608
MKNTFNTSEKFYNSLFAVISLLFIAMVIGLFINSYFVSDVIINESNMCYDNNGSPIVERGFMSLSWSITCE